MEFKRYWAMPNKNTFSIKPIEKIVLGHIENSEVSVDPFAKDFCKCDFNNDIDPETNAEFHLDARVFLQELINKDVEADLILFDPPYSPRQISECYKRIGMDVSMSDTQNSKFIKECRDLINQLADKNDCTVISFGWNSSGMLKAWNRKETILVCHGGSHNDTIICIDNISLLNCI